MTIQVKPKQSQFMRQLREFTGPLLALFLSTPRYGSSRQPLDPPRPSPIFSKMHHPVHHVYRHDDCPDWKLPGFVGKVQPMPLYQ